MSECKLGPQEMEAKLAELERAIDALRAEEVDAVIGAERVFLLRAREAEEQFRAHSDHLDRLLKNRTAQLTRANTELELQLARSEGIELEQDRLRRTLGTIIKCSEVLTRASSEPDYLVQICRTITGEGGYSGCWIGIVVDEERDFAPVGYDNGCLKLLRKGSWEGGRDPTSMALETGKPHLARNIREGPASSGSGLEAVGGNGSCLALPLVIEDRGYGVLHIYAAEPDAFSGDETRLLNRLAEDISYGIAVLRTQAQRDRAERALSASERRYKELAESISDIFFALDDNLKYVYWNKACEELTGITGENALGKSMLEVLPWDANRDREERVYRRVIATKEPVHAIVPSTLRGREYFLEVNVYPAERGVSVFVKDITERVLMEQRLRRSEARLVEAQRIAHVGSWEIDLASRRITWSDEILRMCGLERTEFVGTCEAALDLVHPEDRAQLEKAIDEAEEGKGPLDIEHRIMCSDGSVTTVHLRAELVEEVEGGARLAGTMLDITSTKKLENELRALSRRLVEVQEHERRFIARELHDQIGQSLTYLSLLLDRAVRIPPEGAAQVLGEARVVISELVSQVRSLSLRLRPAMLDDMGLAVALNWLFEQYMAEAGIRVNFYRPEIRDDLPLDLSTAAYRIIQEALTNVARHAHVNEVDVRLSVDDGKIHLEVADRGTGFSPDSVKVSAGLSGMRERARAVGGELNVESAPRAGTRISAVLPLQNSEGKNE